MQRTDYDLPPGHGGEAGLEGGDGNAKQVVVMLFSMVTCQTVAYVGNSGRRGSEICSERNMGRSVISAS